MYQARIERIVRAQAGTTSSINRLILTLVGLGLLSCLTLAFPDTYLLTSTATVTIPFAGPASFKTTLVVLPIILVAVRAFLQIYIDHWQRLDRIVRHFRLAHDPTVSVLQHPLLRFGLGFVIYALAPLALIALAYKAMVFPGWGPIILSFAAIVLLSQTLHRKTSWQIMIIACAFVLSTTVLALHQGYLKEARRPFYLQRANLDRATLEMQNLDEAILSAASLRQSNLKLTTMRGANLWGADISGSNLKGASLEEASLGVADLSHTNAKCANFRHANLERAILEGADLKGANLRRTNLWQANLTNAKLSGADLSEASVEGVNFGPTPSEMKETEAKDNAEQTWPTLCCTIMPKTYEDYADRDCKEDSIMNRATGCDRQAYCESLLSETEEESAKQ